MIEQFKSYFTKLGRLSNAELNHSAEQLVTAENGSVTKLIAHIAEMSARKTALELGYKSLYDYCQRGLNLSEGAVPARIQVANVARRFPELLVALAERRISLTVAGLLARHVRENNVDKLISDCSGKTCKATQEYLVALEAKSVFEPSIRKRPSAQQTVAPPPIRRFRKRSISFRGGASPAHRLPLRWEWSADGENFLFTPSPSTKPTCG